MRGEEEVIQVGDRNAATGALPLVMTAMVVIGAMSVALVSGTVNDVNSLTTMIQKDRGYSDLEISTIQTVGLFMLYFTFFAGIILDRFGPVIAITLGASVSCTGYVIMFASSYLDNDNATLALLVFGYGMVGIGSGSTFVASMGTSIKAVPSRPGIAISLPGVMMSLSMAFTELIENTYKSAVGCDYDCWGPMIAVLVIVMVVFYAFGIGLIGVGAKFGGLAANTAADPPAATEDDRLLPTDPEKVDSTEVVVSFLQAVNILFIKLYWVVAFAYFVGVSIGLIVVTQTTNLWEDFTGNSDWVSTISILYSVANASSNFISGAVSDFLDAKGIMSRKVFVSIYMLVCAAVMLAMAGMGLMTSDETSLQVIYASLMVFVGFAWGTSFTMYPALTGEFFGHLNFGVYFSFVQMGPLVASLVVPYFCSAVYAWTDHFTVVFVTYTVLCTIAGILLFLVKKKAVPLEPPSWAAPVLKHPRLVRMFEKKA